MQLLLGYIANKGATDISVLTAQPINATAQRAQPILVQKLFGRYHY